MALSPNISRNTLYAPAWQPGVALLDISFSGEPFGRHSHAAFAIGAIENGVGGYRARGARQLFPRSTLSLLNPEESHNGFALNAGVSYKMLYVEEEAMARLLDHPGRRGFTHGLPQDRRGEIRAALQFLTRVAESCDPGRSLAFDEALIDLLARVMCRFGQERSCPRGRESKAVRSTCEYLHALVDQHRRGHTALDDNCVTLAGLAERVGLHPHYLLDVFRRETGISPVRYWRQRRIEAAFEDLRGGKALASVATQAGFYDQAHFTRVFKSFYGVTPGRVIR